MATVLPDRRTTVTVKGPKQGFLYTEIYRSSPQARIKMIRSGVKAGDA